MFEQTGYRPKHRRPIPVWDTHDLLPNRARCWNFGSAEPCDHPGCPRHDPARYAERHAMHDADVMVAD